MADLSELNSSQAVKIAGADSTGLENNFVGASANQDLFTANVFQGSNACAAINVGLSLVEAKVGASRLANRKGVTIFHNGNGNLFYGCSGLTISTGTPIFKNTSVSIPCGPNAAVFLIASTATNDVRIIEWV